MLASACICKHRQMCTHGTPTCTMTATRPSWLYLRLSRNACMPGTEASGCTAGADAASVMVGRARVARMRGCAAVCLGVGETHWVTVCVSLLVCSCLETQFADRRCLAPSCVFIVVLMSQNIWMGSNSAHLMRCCQKRTV